MESQNWSKSKTQHILIIDTQLVHTTNGVSLHMLLLDLQMLSLRTSTNVQHVCRDGVVDSLYSIIRLTDTKTHSTDAPFAIRRRVGSDF